MADKINRVSPKIPKLNRRDHQQLSARKLQRLVHELMNQLTIMNLCCFQFRQAAQHTMDPSISMDIGRMENSIGDMTSLMERLFRLTNPASLQDISADGADTKPERLPSQARNVYPLFKPDRRPR